MLGKYFGVCLKCAKEFKKKWSKDEKFCSLKCNYIYKKGRRRKPVRLCEICQKPIKSKSLKVKRCSRKCYGKSISKPLTEARKEKIKEGLKNRNQSGDKNPHWCGGTTPKRLKIYNSVKYKEWRKAVFKRDNYNCQNCKIKRDLIAHHIKSFSRYPELRFVVDNGKTLCLDCHRKEHGFKRSFKPKVLGI